MGTPHCACQQALLCPSQRHHRVWKTCLGSVQCRFHGSTLEPHSFHRNAPCTKHASVTGTADAARCSSPSQRKLVLLQCTRQVSASHVHGFVRHVPRLAVLPTRPTRPCQLRLDCKGVTGLPATQAELPGRISVLFNRGESDRALAAQVQ